MTITLYNSLTNTIEDFTPIKENSVNMYSCGPTVYSYAHIGNFRTYLLTDFVHRILLANGYEVRFIMNLTDVGHLTGDNLGDADIGEDRLEKAADAENKSAKEIADFYIKHFLIDYERLNILKPQKFTRATDYIKDQIALIRELEKKGYTYQTTDGIYFDTSRFKDYGKLSGNTKESILEGARVEPNKEKKNPTDFSLWKFSPANSQRWQEWESPWGVGFPGWHIECSAMALKELGERLDIHIGGEDLRMIHHQNEIAQSECATGKKYVNYWLHQTHLKVDDGRMGKSLGNTYTISDIEAKGFSPLAYRYFCMTAHYRSPLNFTWGAVQSADNALKKLYTLVDGYKTTADDIYDLESYDNFMHAINSDVNMPKALALLWEMLKSDLAEGVKLATLTKFDEVLGFGIDNYINQDIPDEVYDLAKTRDFYRRNCIWEKADQIRKQILAKGYIVEDSGDAFKIKRKI